MGFGSSWFMPVDSGYLDTEDAFSRADPLFTLNNHNWEGLVLVVHAKFRGDLVKLLTFAL